MIRSSLLAAAAVLALTGCAAQRAAPPAAPAEPVPDAVASADATAALSASGYRMFETLRGKAGPGENTFIAPVSIQQALGLVHPGARGTTASQIEGLLGLPAGPATDSALAAQRQAIAGKADTARVALANALWLKQDFRFAPTYLATARDQYAATAERLDFARAPKAAADRINGWAKEKTEGLITDVVSADGFNDATLAVLTNALFFEGKWVTPFNQASPQPFLFGDGTQRPVPLMSKSTAVFAYAEGDGWKAVRLPYQSGDRFHMDVFLPLGRNPRAMLPAATFRKLTGALDAAEPEPVVVTLPRFDIAWKATLNETLQQLGMRDAFVDGAADLSGIVDPPARNLVISKVSHLTRLQVFEEGTRAAAVTAVDIVVTSAPIRPPRQFRADQPFHLAIRERRGHLLFVGRIAKPAT